MNASAIWMDAYARHYKKGDIQDAIALYNKLVDTYPDSDEAKYALKQLEIISKNRSQLGLSIYNNDNVKPENIKVDAYEKNKLENNPRYLDVYSKHTGKAYDKYKKLFNFNCYDTVDALDREYKKLKDRWDLDNFLADPKMYQKAIDVNKDIDEAYDTLRMDFELLTQICQHDDKAKNIVMSTPSDSYQSEGLKPLWNLIGGILIVIVLIVATIHPLGATILGIPLASIAILGQWLVRK